MRISITSKAGRTTECKPFDTDLTVTRLGLSTPSVKIYGPDFNDDARRFEIVVSVDTLRDLLARAIAANSSAE